MSDYHDDAGVEGGQGRSGAEVLDALCLIAILVIAGVTALAVMGVFK